MFTERKGALVDIELGERYKIIIEKGKQTFADSALISAGEKISESDIDLIDRFHHEISPANVENPYRIVPKTDQPGSIRDSSFFSNWDKKGGPAEHMHLAVEAAKIVVRELKSRASQLPGDTGKISIQSLDDMTAVAGTAFHEEGRFLTHLLGTHDAIRDVLLKKIGIREDIRSSFFDDDTVLKTPATTDMQEVVDSLPISQLVVKIADEYGRRSTVASDQTVSWEEFSVDAQRRWAESYQQKPLSGRPTERKVRTDLELLVENTERFRVALDNRLHSEFGISLPELVGLIHDDLTPRLDNLE